ncbi:MAG: hypothetical protein ACRD1Y_02620 [Terriglobales bacterium]
MDWLHVEQWEIYKTLREGAPGAYQQIGQTEIERAEAEYEPMRMPANTRK